MGTFHVAVDIDRQPAEVFTLVADPRMMPRWYEAVDDVVQTTDGPTGPGARYRVTRTLPGGTAHNDLEVTEHQPNQRVTLESLNGPTPFRYRYTLEPTVEGTRLNLEGRITSDGLPGPIGKRDRLATHLFERGMQQNLTQVKRTINR